MGWSKKNKVFHRGLQKQKSTQSPPHGMHSLGSEPIILKLNQPICGVTAHVTQSDSRFVALLITFTIYQSNLSKSQTKNFADAKLIQHGPPIAAQGKSSFYFKIDETKDTDTSLYFYNCFHNYSLLFGIWLKGNIREEGKKVVEEEA